MVVCFEDCSVMIVLVHMRRGSVVNPVRWQRPASLQPVFQQFTLSPLAVGLDGDLNLGPREAALGSLLVHGAHAFGSGDIWFHLIPSYVLSSQHT